MAGNRGRGKTCSLSEWQSRQRNVEDSGPRHPGSRGVLASVRRGDDLSGEQTDESFTEEGGEPVELSDEYLSEDNYADDLIEDLDREAEFQQEHFLPRSEEDVTSRPHRRPPQHRPPCDIRVVRDRRGRFDRQPPNETASSSTTSRKRRAPSSSTPDWVVTGHMPGGPLDALVIPSYGGHVARWLWEGTERVPTALLGFQSRHKSCVALCRVIAEDDVEFSKKKNVSDAADDIIEEVEKETEEEQKKKKPMSKEARAIVEATGLLHLPEIMFHTLDVALLTAFVERWQPDTNTFHLPFGEMTILLHDVAKILAIPVEGSFPTSPASSIRDVATLLGKSEDTLKATKVWQHGGVKIGALLELCSPTYPHVTQSKAWLFSAIGCTLLVDKSRNLVMPQTVAALDRVSKISWGAATLAYLYRQLGMASRYGTAQLAGCLTLLQAWIYEYFHCFRPQRAKTPIGEKEPRALSWDVVQHPQTDNRLIAYRCMLDNLTPDQVTWCPYGPDPAASCTYTTYQGFIRCFDIVEPYMPDRTVRQLGYIQPIPDAIIPPQKVSRPASGKYVVEHPIAIADGTWARLPRGSRMMLDQYHRVRVPSDVDEDYTLWFQQHSHPIIIKNPEVPMTSLPDPSSSDWWLAEFTRRCMPMRGCEPDQVPTEVIADIQSLIEQWAQAMQLPPPPPSPNH